LPPYSIRELCYEMQWDATRARDFHSPASLLHLRMNIALLPLILLHVRFKARSRSFDPPLSDLDPRLTLLTGKRESLAERYLVKNWIVNVSNPLNLTTDVDKIPGPATYTVATNLDGVGATLSGWQKAPEIKKMDPAKYTIASVNDAPSYTLGKLFSKRYITTPGPLDYDPNAMQSKLKAPSITLQHKSSYVIKEITKPAPNKYFPKLSPSQVSATLKGRYKETKALSLETPGPANYIIPNNMYYGIQVGLAPRPEVELTTYNAGPTTYNPRIDFTHRNNPVYTLGEKINSNKKKNKTPSPATYILNDRQIRNNDAPKYSLKSRHTLSRESSDEQSSPGPADYISLKTHTLTVSQKARNEIIMRESLSRHLLDAKRGSISKTPGPSDYNVEHGKPREGFSLGKRLEEIKNESKPSPSTYNVRSGKSKNAIRMKGRNSPFVVVFPSTRIDTLRFK
jgi:hypothetical protein